MSSVQHLREFIKERLTAAAEEIFTEFEKTIVQYEEEVDRQSRLLALSRKPQRHPNTADLLRQTATEEVLLTDPKSHVQERKSTQTEQEPEPSEIKNEGREVSISQEGEQLVLKQETIALIRTLHNEHDYCEPNRTLFPSQTRPAPENQAEHLEQKKRQQTDRSHGHSADTSVLSGGPFNRNTGKKSLECDVCGKLFKYRYILKNHYIIHTGERPYACNTCGKRFFHNYRLLAHRKIHTGEKPYLCNTCGKRFSDSSTLKKHAVTHTGERPHSCETCGKSFSLKCTLNAHMTTHLGGTPFLCSTCGKRFTYKATLKRHMRTHTGEAPYSCKVCGKGFKCSSSLNVHLPIHSTEKQVEMFQS